MEKIKIPTTAEILTNCEGWDGSQFSISKDGTPGEILLQNNSSLVVYICTSGTASTDSFQLPSGAAVSMGVEPSRISVFAESETFLQILATR